MPTGTATGTVSVPAAAFRTGNSGIDEPLDAEALHTAVAADSLVVYREAGKDGATANVSGSNPEQLTLERLVLQPKTPSAWTGIKVRHNAPDDSLSASTNGRGRGGGSDSGTKAAQSVTRAQDHTLSQAEVRLYGVSSSKKKQRQQQQQQGSTQGRGGKRNSGLAAGGSSLSTPQKRNARVGGGSSPLGLVGDGATRARGPSLVVNEASLSQLPALEAIDAEDEEEERLGDGKGAISANSNNSSDRLPQGPAASTGDRHDGGGGGGTAGYVVRVATAKPPASQRQLREGDTDGPSPLGNDKTRGQKRKNNNASSVIFPETGLGSAEDEALWRAVMERKGSKASMSRRTSVASEGQLVWARSPTPEAVISAIGLNPRGQQQQQLSISYHTNNRNSAPTPFLSSVGIRHPNISDQRAVSYSHYSAADEEEWKQGRDSRGWHLDRAGPNEYPVRVLPHHAPDPPAGRGHGDSTRPEEGQEAAEERRLRRLLEARYADENFARSVDDVLLKHNHAAAAPTDYEQDGSTTTNKDSPTTSSMGRFPAAPDTTPSPYNDYYRDYDNFTSVPRTFVGNTASLMPRKHLDQQHEQQRGSAPFSSQAPPATAAARKDRRRVAFVEHLGPLVEAQRVSLAPRTPYEDGKDRARGANPAHADDSPPPASHSRSRPKEYDSGRLSSHNETKHHHQHRQHHHQQQRSPHRPQPSPKSSPRQQLLRAVYGGGTRGEGAAHARRGDGSSKDSKAGKGPNKKRGKTRQKEQQRRTSRAAPQPSAFSVRDAATTALEADRYGHVLTRHGFWGEEGQRGYA